MAEPDNPLLAFSQQVAELVERVAAGVVTVHAGARGTSSGIHWRSGVVVTAEEALQRDEGIKLTLMGGRQMDATLAGRDPTTDVAVLRFQPDGLPAAATANAVLRAGQTVVAVGAHEGGALAALGIVAYAGGPWRSMRGGTIDSLVRLDLALTHAGEGGALVDASGRIVGMTVLGPRRRALAIPSATIDRAVDQLLARGHVFRGYLGAGLQAVGRRRTNGEPSASIVQGVLVTTLDPAGPSARAGMLVGDIVTTWSGKQVQRVRDVFRLLGPESIGSTVAMGVIRGGAPTEIQVVIGERPVA
ncbi:MAG: serine protease [Hyphomicrobiales bacterium]|nr:serine protease [Hyphomicrobiales bacterium]